MIPANFPNSEKKSTQRRKKKEKYKCSIIIASTQINFRNHLHCPPLWPENEILTRFGPGVSTSETLSDSSSALRFLETFLFLLPSWVEMRGSSGTVGVDPPVMGVADSSCWSCFYTAKPD